MPRARDASSSTPIEMEVRVSSRLCIVPADHAHEFDTWEGAATFILPIKGVFGRELCGTDGTIGYPTFFDSARALEIVAKCEPRWPGDARDLDKVRRWALLGKQLYAQH